MSALPPIRSWLYAPGNNAKLLDRVFGAGADAVILDLEDAVPPDEKERARQMVAETVRAKAGTAGPALFVRVNHPDTRWSRDDVVAVVQPALRGLRIPKVESAEQVHRVHSWLATAESAAGLPIGSVRVVCNLESATGVWRAAEIGAASPRVHALNFGAVDFERDVGASIGPDETETLFARSQLVLASRVVGLRPPIDSVYRFIQDDEGLIRSTQRARALGFFGRSAIHPRQVPVINEVFTPSSADVAWATEVVQQAHAAESRRSGAIQLASGEFVDIPVVQRAQQILDLARQLSPSA